MQITEEQIYWIDPDSMYERWWPLEDLEDHSILVRESLPPFAFVLGHPGQRYDVWTVRQSKTPLDLYLVGAPSDYEDLYARQFPDAEVYHIDLEDIGAEVQSHGYRAVAMEGTRERSAVNDELLVFDPKDLEVLSAVQELHTARVILSILQKSAV